MSVTRVPEYSPHSVAEFALTLLMALNRKIVKSHCRTKSGNFSLSGLTGWDVYGKTIGVIGTGKIGVCFTKIMIGMGCKILCMDPYPNAELAAHPSVQYVPIEELLAKSDVISMHTPLNPATTHLINDNTVALMKDGVYIINTSRGKLIDSTCLIRGLKSGKIAACGLDVYEGESRYFFNDGSDENIEDEVLLRLLAFNNVIVTSHQSFLTNEALTNIAHTTVQNIKEMVVDGKELDQLTHYVK
jgi:D-lactate dehydrogenase